MGMWCESYEYMATMDPRISFAEHKNAEGKNLTQVNSFLKDADNFDSYLLSNEII